MKKQMKMMISIMVTAVMLVVLIPLAFATENSNFSVILTANNTVKRGETVEVTVELDEFTGIGKGINTFMGNLEYDKTKLSIESSQIVAQNGWDSPMYENDKILTAKGSMVTAKEAVIKMAFTVKSDAELGTTTIVIKNAEAANDESDFVGEAGTITIEIVEETIPPVDDGKEDEEIPPVDDGKEDEEIPPVDDGKEDEEIPPVDDGKEDEEIPPVDDGKEDEEIPPVDDGKEDEEIPPADDGKEDEEVPTVDNEKEEEKDDTIADKEYDNAGVDVVTLLAMVIVAVVAVIMHLKNKKYEDIR